MPEFRNRIYGCIAVKAINSNYNADFSGQPRRLPNGEIYSTDKANKYPIKNYIKNVYPEEKILFFKRFNPRKDDFIPFSLIEAFCNMFPDLAEISATNKKKDKSADTTETETVENSNNNDKKETIKLKATQKQVGQALLSCIDVRLFGATFAAKGAKKEDNVAISIHGPVQINYGINLWREGQIYCDQIMSPFRNPGETDSDDKHATTLGRQFRLDEGHYIHHFSINPQNLIDVALLAGEDAQKLSTADISKLKEAMRRGVTWYNSTSKAGCENEMLVWIQLKENSKIVLPNISTLIELEQVKENGKCVYNFANLKEKLLEEYGEDENGQKLLLKDDVEKIEIYLNLQTVKLNLGKDSQGKDIEFEKNCIEGVPIEIYNI